MKTILFVCTGNTCRSPMSAAIVNSLHDSEFYAESAGIDAFFKDGINQGSLDTLRFVGTPIDERNPYPEHRSRRIKEEDIEKASLVVGITATHVKILQERFPSYRDKIISFPGDISDPCGKDTTAYLAAMSDIRHGVALILNDLCAEASGIYPASRLDVPTLCKIENDSFSTPWTRDSFLLGMNNPTNHTVILKENGNVLGFAVYSVLFEDAELYDIAVAPAHRKRGIGEALLKAVLKDTAERGADTIRLEVRQSNLPARKLYEKYGFVYDKAVRKNYYQKPTEDALLMYLTPIEITKEPS